MELPFITYNLPTFVEDLRDQTDIQWLFNVANRASSDLFPQPVVGSQSAQDAARPEFSVVKRDAPPSAANEVVYDLVMTFGERQKVELGSFSLYSSRT